MSVVFAGRVGRRKGVDTLLNAWNIVSRTEPAAELTIIGPLDPDLSDAERVALAPYHVGELPPAEVQARLRTAACATLPSRAEGQPMFLIEALAFGVPIVVTDVGGMPLLAQDAGSVVKAGDHTGLARAILKILANDESIGRARLNATAKYQEQFSLAAHDRGLLTLYALRPGFRSKKKELSQ
jgi:glycosyltransferase involved in cell wall biosynthesis